MFTDRAARRVEARNFVDAGNGMMNCRLADQELLTPRSGILQEMMARVFFAAPLSTIRHTSRM